MNKFLDNKSVFFKTITPPLLSFCVIAGSLIYAGRSLKDALGNIADVSSTVAVGSIQTTLSSVHASMYKLLSLASAGTSDKTLQAMGQEQLTFLKDIQSQLSSLPKGSISPDQDSRQIEAIKSEVTDYTSNIKKVLDMLSVDQSIATLLMKPADKNYEQAAKNLRNVEASRLTQVQAGYESSMQKVKDTIIRLVLSLVVGGILVFSLSLMIARSVYVPLRDLVAFVEQVAGGNLLHHLKMERLDEIGTLARALESMRSNFRRMIGRNTEIIHDISEASVSQSSAIVEVSTSISSVSMRARESEKKTLEVDSLTVAIEGELSKSREYLGNFCNTIAQIMEASKRANDIVKAIEGLAFQTNLLALNAAVEAARAGDAGSGFAVVAEEVRNLAQRASVAANNTSTIINKIATDIKTGDELLASTTNSFDGVIASSKHIKELVSNICQGSNEQNSSIAQITSVMSDINNSATEHLNSAQKLKEASSMFQA